MGVKFDFKGHELHVDQYIRSIRLYVDGKQADVVSGFVETQLNDVTLETVLHHSDQSEDRIRITVKRQLLTNEVTLFANDEKVETKHLI
jgi:propanediol dehydratase small subunit